MAAKRRKTRKDKSNPTGGFFFVIFGLFAAADLMKPL